MNKYSCSEVKKSGEFAAFHAVEHREQVAVGEAVIDVHAAFVAEQHAFVFHLDEVVRQQRLLGGHIDSLLDFAHAQRLLGFEHAQHLQAHRVADGFEDVGNAQQAFRVEATGLGGRGGWHQETK